ncbi:MAG: serine/threonine protein kinase [Chloroflexi bacterium]|nr:MAG: serine/threonine protein kinase [Chloroflexota bacterium]
MSTELRHLGKYELQKRLAHGGMGEVWKARDTQLGRYVAIKLLRTDMRHNPDFVARFEREAQLIAALRHSHIVQIHDFQVASTSADGEDTMAYMVMDYVEGQTLADYLRATSRKGQFPPATDILYLFTGISLALDYAHKQGMVHRDIKPANILLDQRLPNAKPMGEPVLTDFGIARLQGAASRTVIGSLLGTPLYISPEQAQGHHGDRRGDLYSLGVILYEMVTGVTPFRGANTLAILMQHLHEMPTPPALINPNISAELSAVILKSLAKKPEDRFSSASELTLAMAEAMHLPPPARLLPLPASDLPLGKNANGVHLSSLTPTGGLHIGVQQPAAGPYRQAGNALPPQRAVTTPLPAATPSQAAAPAVPHQPAPADVPAPPRRNKGRKIRLIAFLILVLILGSAGLVLLKGHMTRYKLRSTTLPIRPLVAFTMPGLKHLPLRLLFPTGFLA